MYALTLVLLPCSRLFMSSNVPAGSNLSAVRIPYCTHMKITHTLIQSLKTPGHYLWRKLAAQKKHPELMTICKDLHGMHAIKTVCQKRDMHWANPIQIEKHAYRSVSLFWPTRFALLLIASHYGINGYLQVQYWNVGRLRRFWQLPDGRCRPTFNKVAILSNYGWFMKLCSEENIINRKRHFRTAETSIGMDERTAKTKRNLYRYENKANRL